MYTHHPLNHHSDAKTILGNINNINSIKMLILIVFSA